MKQVDLENLLRDAEGRAELDEIAKELERNGGEKEAATEKKPFVWPCALRACLEIQSRNEFSTTYSDSL